MENRCEELQRLLDESRGLLEKQQQLQKRRRRKSSSQQRQHKSDDEEEKKNYNSSASDTESERTSSSSSTTEEGTTQESGYSSGSIGENLIVDSDSEMSSPDREQPKSLEIIEASVEVLSAQVTAVKEDKLEIQERLLEMEKVVGNLQAENKRLQMLLVANSDCMQDSFRSVDDEVQDIHDVR